METPENSHLDTNFDMRKNQVLYKWKNSKFLKN